MAFDETTLTNTTVKKEDHFRIKKHKNGAGSMHGVITKALDAYELVLELKRNPTDDKIIHKLIAL